jgi:hypothetical protein
MCVWCVVCGVIMHVCAHYVCVGVYLCVCKYV